MANNRNIIDYIEGDLIARDRDEIRDIIEKNLSAVYGENVINSSELYFFTELWYSTYQAICEMNTTYALKDARGQHLDNIIKLISGMSRRVASASIAGRLILIMPKNIETSYGRWTLTTSEGIEWNCNSISENPIEGNENHSEYILSNVECDSFGDYVIDGGTVFESLYVGGAFRTDDIIISNTENTRPLMSFIGSLVESDPQFKARFEQLSAEGSKTLVASVKSELLEHFAGIINDVVVINSNKSGGLELDVMCDGGVEQTVAIPEHDIFIIIQALPGVGLSSLPDITEAIAKTLQDIITVGISTLSKADSSLAGEDSYITHSFNAGGNFEETVRFKIASPYTTAINIKLKPAAGVTINPGAKTAIKNYIQKEIVAYSKTYKINQSIDITRLREIAASYEKTNRNYELDDRVGAAAVELTFGADTKYGYWSAKNDDIIIEWAS